MHLKRIMHALEGEIREPFLPLYNRSKIWTELAVLAETFSQGNDLKGVVHALEGEIREPRLLFLRTASGFSGSLLCLEYRLRIFDKCLEYLLRRPDKQAFEHHHGHPHYHCHNHHFDHHLE